MNDSMYSTAQTPLEVAYKHASLFTPEFLNNLPTNLHVYDAFEREAHKVIARGYRHYSAKTILEVLRHHSALTDAASAWKLNNNTTAYLARLFSLLNPANADLFEFRATKARRAA